MRVPAVAIGVPQTTASIAVYAGGVYGEAVAAVLAMRGNTVRLIGTQSQAASTCDIVTRSRARYTSNVEFLYDDNYSSLRSHNTIVLACSATSYGDALESICRSLNSGQTIYIVGAALGAALEVGYFLEGRRQDLNLNIVEVTQPFGSYERVGDTMLVRDVRDKLYIAGRSLNETRAGLSNGSHIFSSLVPASNILERGFADLDEWLQTAALLFSVFQSNSRESVSAVVLALRNELLSLGKAYGVNRVPDSSWLMVEGIDVAVAKSRLIQRVIEDFAILSSLARLKYMPVPLLDAIVELSSVATGLDLRKEGRQLTDMGLIGMDAQEIMELVSA